MNVISNSFSFEIDFDQDMEFDDVIEKQFKITMKSVSEITTGARLLKEEEKEELNTFKSVITIASKRKL